MHINDVIERCWADPDFAAALQADPKSLLASVGIDWPDGAQLRVHCNSAREVHLVIPQTATPEQAGPLLAIFIRRYNDDPIFREQIATNATLALRAVFGIDLPVLPQLVVHLETAQCSHFVLPIKPIGAQLHEIRRYALAGSMLTPRRGR